MGWLMIGLLALITFFNRFAFFSRLTRYQPGVQHCNPRGIRLGRLRWRKAVHVSSDRANGQAPAWRKVYCSCITVAKNLFCRVAVAAQPDHQ